MLTAAVCCLALYSAPDYRKNLETIVEAERAFARTCAIQGQRDSFIAWFAEDGIGFTPHPVKQREAFEKLPAEEKPLKTLLTWEPKLADCSSVGDLGFTTGPYRVIDLGPEKKPILTGAYFTIWRKQNDGSMKVVLDLGTPMTAAPVFPPKMRIPGQPSPAFVTADLADRAKENLGRFEEDIAKSTADELPKTLGQQYDPKPIVYRPGLGPLMTSAEGVNWWNGAKLTLKEWTVTAISLSRSADFAYCYGKYSAEGGRSGYFVHVWKSEYGKGWHIVADVMTSLPEG